MKPSRRQFIRAASGAALAAAFRPALAGQPAATQSDAGRPNILFIFADDLGISELGCYGGKYRTPNLDALAAGGTRFDYCFSAPLCGPSRAECLTGRYGFRTGVVGNTTGRKLRPADAFTVAATLRAAGYATAVAGKWPQLEYFDTPEQAARWGFDESIVWRGSGTPDRYWSPKYFKNGKAAAGGPNEYGPDWLNEFAIDFLARQQAAGKPFFLYYPTPLIHFPILRTPDSKPGARRGALFADNIEYLDKQVGQLVAALDRMKLRERTAIVFTGDNGPQTVATIGGRKVDGAKGKLTEGGSRVPLIVNWKGTTPPGRLCEDLTDFSDFHPTFAELAGAALPAGVPIDGRSFAPQLRGQAGRPREWVYVQLDDHWYIRDKRWKLYDDGVLCDMSEAPFAEKRVADDAADPQAAEARRRLGEALKNLRK